MRAILLFHMKPLQLRINLQKETRLTIFKYQEREGLLRYQERSKVRS